MAERTINPNSPACGPWERLLAEALDGLLKPADEAAFSAHRAACPACAALFEESRRGREWLTFLTAEPEIPDGLVEKILAKTGPGQIADHGLVADNVIPITPAWHQPGFMGFIRRFAEPRLMMTAAMAFFSLALTLNMTGLRLSQLRPSAIGSLMERRLTMASTPFIRYYDHSRLVYEVQTTVRELRRTTQSDGDENGPRQAPAPGESKQAPGRGNPQIDSPEQAAIPDAGPTQERSTLWIA
jgi:hypothetical protein